MTKKQMKALLKGSLRKFKGLLKSIRSISKDGKAFDGNQKAVVRNLIAKAFFAEIKDSLITWWFDYMKSMYPNIFRFTVQ